MCLGKRYYFVFIGMEGECYVYEFKDQLQRVGSQYKYRVRKSTWCSGRWKDLVVRGKLGTTASVDDCEDDDVAPRSKCMALILLSNNVVIMSL